MCVVFQGDKKNGKREKRAGGKIWECGGKQGEKKGGGGGGGRGKRKNTRKESEEGKGGRRIIPYTAACSNSARYAKHPV